MCNIREKHESAFAFLEKLHMVKEVYVATSLTREELRWIALIVTFLMLGTIFPRLSFTQLFQASIGKSCSSVGIGQ